MHYFFYQLYNSCPWTMVYGPWTKEIRHITKESKHES